jgi:hypothetical protein
VCHWELGEVVDKDVDESFDVDPVDTSVNEIGTPRVICAIVPEVIDLSA